ncbi:hypothetical protein BH10BAC2_BH10BAC2_25530 [soil metagenome]
MNPAFVQIASPVASHSCTEEYKSVSQKDHHLTQSSFGLSVLLTSGLNVQVSDTPLAQ